MSPKESLKNNQVPITNYINLVALVVALGFSIYFVVVSVLILNNTSKPCFEIEKPLVTYSRLKDTLESGKKLRLVMDYNKMTFNGSSGVYYGRNEKSGFDFQDFQYFGKMSIGNPQAYLITSFNKFIVHPRYGPIYNYGKLTINEDETYELLSYFITPDTFNILVIQLLNGTMANGGLGLFQMTP